MMSVSHDCTFSGDGLWSMIVFFATCLILLLFTNYTWSQGHPETVIGRGAGVLFIILIYALREHEVLRMIPSFLLGRPWIIIWAFLPISLYNGKRGFIKGKVLKYAFYVFYPAHIFVIWMIKYHIFF